MNVKSYAKINLALDIIKKSGKYHQIQTVFQRVNLYDELIFRKTNDDKITLQCDDPRVPMDSRNTIMKAVFLVKKIATTKETTKKNITGLHITLKKNIPLSAGLGGGSSNAAATLQALNKLWKLHMSKRKLEQIATTIGMDVVFFLNGETAVGTHFGEKISPLPAIRHLHLILAGDSRVIPDKTKKKYQQLDHTKTGQAIGHTKHLIANLKSQRYSNIEQYFHNDFDTAGRLEKKREQIKKKLLHTGAHVVLTCGSGPVIFALYKNAAIQRDAFKKLQGHISFLWKN